MGNLPRSAPLAVLALSLGGCSFGPSELLIIFAIVVLLFGATRLPALGKALGETVKSFRESTDDDNNKSSTLSPGTKEVAGQIEEARVELSDAADSAKSQPTRSERDG